jgi:hypothetical protein
MAYTKQDEAIHDGKELNYRLLYTPKQLKRLRKKELATSKREAAKFGMTVHKAPF